MILESCEITNAIRIRETYGDEMIPRIQYHDKDAVKVVIVYKEKHEDKTTSA